MRATRLPRADVRARAAPLHPLCRRCSFAPRLLLIRAPGPANSSRSRQRHPRDVADKRIVVAAERDVAAAAQVAAVATPEGVGQLPAWARRDPADDPARGDGASGQERRRERSAGRGASRRTWALCVTGAVSSVFTQPRVLTDVVRPFARPVHQQSVRAHSRRERRRGAAAARTAAQLGGRRAAIISRRRGGTVAIVPTPHPRAARRSRWRWRRRCRPGWSGGRSSRP